MYMLVLDEEDYLQVVIDVTNENVVAWGGPEDFKVIMVKDYPELEPGIDPADHKYNYETNTFFIPDEVRKRLEEEANG